VRQPVGLLRIRAGIVPISICMVWAESASERAAIGVQREEGEGEERGVLAGRCGEGRAPACESDT
jgi:hypothetical protein